MLQFPLLTAGVVTMTPATIGAGFATRVQRFCNDAEQRWASRGQYGVFVLTLTSISGFDLSNIRDFFRTVKGRFDATWSLAINGTTYFNMVLDSDDLAVVEQHPNSYNLQIKCHQWSGAFAPAGVPGLGGMLIFPGYAITYLTDWEDQPNLGDHSYGNADLKVAFDALGNATLTYMGAPKGTAASDNFGWQGTAYVGATAGAGPVTLAHQFAVGEELIAELYVNSKAITWYSGPASRNSDDCIHESLSIL
jgi:hypothetical protein